MACLNFGEDVATKGFTFRARTLPEIARNGRLCCALEGSSTICVETHRMSRKEVRTAVFSDRVRQV